MKNEKTVQQLNIPNHIAIIPDGNRRWATENGLPALEGHRKGAEAVKNVMRKSRELGVHTMTLWGFSTENWNRSDEEVSYLMKIFESYIQENIDEAHKYGVRIYHLGRKDRMPEPLRNGLLRAEEETKNYTNYDFNIAIDYGGQDEIIRVVEKVVKDVESGVISVEELSKVTGRYNDKYPFYLLKSYFDTKEQLYPYPDLLIRTSGERRLSGFLPWQTAYSEIYFSDVHMPAFDEKELMKAIEDFNTRDRRFGGNTTKK
ncbi:MAG: Isoprenyl transferase [Candidatus Woesebacteria bacterium GW2011_GWB1_40_12]|jgi:undecaprenyl diphosphate synthase|uniref:Isoprenyl transferase n=1 Tax=Candidatus Woesebacteria bacterium GW2011_GWB1_40_12 TaxID=1618576 RepID=A0A0G0QQU8_9BACT|nr:MAG: Isoprenyl transferase [Candidatus Woesebacteria bacterium GW2011_GWB1_40_12]